MAYLQVVLIVDDSRLIVERLIALLNEQHYVKEVLISHSYEDAIKLIDLNSDIDTFILDVKLPGKSGLDILQYLKAKDYEAKNIIVLTDAPSKELMERCLTLGAHHFLNKFSEFEKIPELIKNNSR
ncbi:MAG TPA: response regulator [Mucilaginibacter sp.]|nr:response regulator [Mucilaginibacter sp.]